MNKNKSKKAASRNATGKPKVRSGEASVRPKTRLRITKSKSKAAAKPRVRDDEIWIYDPTTGEISQEPVPYDLLDEDVIVCYDPFFPEAEPAIETFEVQNIDTGQEVITYNCSDDPTQETLEIDLAVLEQFEENYDPQTGGSGQDEPYTIEDETGSIGING